MVQLMVGPLVDCWVGAKAVLLEFLLVVPLVVQKVVW